jgi:hypothetical protein
MEAKVKNNIDTTFIGGNSSPLSCVTGKPPMTRYDWHCIYGRLRITYDRHILTDEWRHHSIHWNNVNNGGIAWNFHWAFNSKYPFIRIGFKSIKHLYK